MQGSSVAHNTDVGRFIRSIQGICERIPFITPVVEDRIFIKPSELTNVPQRLKSKFEIVLRYKLNIPYKAACLIYSPKEVVTIVIIINKRYESLFHQYLKQFPNDRHLNDACERRSVYMHEMCHLSAAIRLFPENYDINTRRDFVTAIETKFCIALKDAEGGQFFAHFERTVPPFIFNNDHFSFNDDKFNYHDLYQELMISDDEIKKTVEKMFEPETHNKLKKFPINLWIAMLTHIDPAFFMVFGEKREKFLEEIASHFPNTAGSH